MAESASNLIADGAKKKTRSGKFTLFTERYNELDPVGAKSEFFTEVKASNTLLTAVEPFTLDDWRRQMQSTKGKRYTITLTWDRKHLKGIQYDVVEQWKRMKTIVYHIANKRSIKYYLVPELHEDLHTVHCHGIMIFQGEKEWKMSRNQSHAMQAFMKKIGPMVQRHGIYELYEPYTVYGYQGNHRQKIVNASLQKWHEYCHGLSEDKVNKEKVYEKLKISSNFKEI